jgi:hypothetical protein
MKTKTLRPCLLVQLNTSLKGNVKYDKRDIKRDHIVDGAKVAQWETERTISNPEEFEAATALRSKCRATITRVCSKSSFGLICPEDREEELRKAIETAEAEADAFNETSELTDLKVRAMVGRVAADDVQAVKAINSEIRDLLDDMATGIRNCDVDAVRSAANQARAMSQTLEADAAARVRMAIDEARAAAKKIAQAGEVAAQEVDLLAIKRINEQRTAFLDLDDAVAVETPTVEGRTIDLAPNDEPMSAPKTTAPALEM